MKESRPEKRCYTCTWWKPLTKKCTCEQAEKKDEVTDQMWYCEYWLLDDIAKKIYEIL